MKRTLQAIVLLGMGIALIAGVAVLLQWRLEKGDSYPAYSTLRADPQGARAFYETLERLRPGKVRRNFIPLGREDVAPKTTWLFLGVSTTSTSLVSQAADDHFRDVLARGGHVVLGLGEMGRMQFLYKAAEEEAERNEAKQRKEDEENADDPIAKRRIEARRQRAGWLLHDIDTRPILVREESSLEAELASRTVESPWPEVYRSRQPRVFEDPPAGWQTLYRYEDEPMVIQHTLGRGSITLLNDSFVFSNEALYHDRQTAFLEALLGDAEQFVFDETHLGSIQQRGVMNLIQDYGLQGVLIGFFTLALLYIWRAGSSLLPAHSTLATDDHVLGESSQEGFQHFLAHHLDGDHAVTECVNEWQRSWGKHAENDPEVAGQLRAARELLTDPSVAKESTTALYNRLAKILTRKHFS